MAEVRNVDSFYQAEYPGSCLEYNFGGEFTLLDGSSTRGIPIDVDKIRIDSKDSIGTPAGELLVAKDGGDALIKLHFVDALYSGDREKRIKPISSDWGERISFRGINIDTEQKLDQIKPGDFLKVETRNKAWQMLLELLSKYEVKTRI